MGFPVCTVLNGLKYISISHAAGPDATRCNFTSPSRTTTGRTALTSSLSTPAAKTTLRGTRVVKGNRLLAHRHGRPVSSRSSLVVKSGLCMDVTEASFEAEVLNSSVPVLCDFWADWCGPCKLVATTMEQLQKEYGGALKVVKIECDSNPVLVEVYKVYGLPALILFKDGAMVDGSHKEGAMTKAKIQNFLAEHNIVTSATA